MRVVLFFTCLCYLLLQGHSAIYAGSGHGSLYSTRTLHSRELQQINRAYTDAGCLAAVNHYLVTDLEEDGIDDADDEDMRSLPAAAYGLPARSHPIHVYPSYVSLLRRPSNCFKAAPAPFPGQAPDINILQGVLRI